MPRTIAEIERKKEKLIDVINELKNKNQICSDFKIGDYFVDNDFQEYYANEDCTAGPFATGEYIVKDGHCIKYSSNPPFYITPPGEGTESESYAIPFAEEEEEEVAVGGKRKNRRGKTMRGKTMRGKISRGKKTTQKGGVLGLSNKEKLIRYIEELRAAGEIKPELTLDKVLTKKCDSYPVYEKPSFEKEKKSVNPLYGMAEAEENYPLADPEEEYTDRPTRQEIEKELTYVNNDKRERYLYELLNQYKEESSNAPIKYEVGPNEDLYAVPTKKTLEWIKKGVQGVQGKGIRIQPHLNPGQTKGWPNNGGKRKTKRKRSGSKRSGSKTKRKRS